LWAVVNINTLLALFVLYTRAKNVVDFDFFVVVHTVILFFFVVFFFILVEIFLVDVTETMVGVSAQSCRGGIF
jgi:hypothetical protein